jgi:hypothetical protein
MGAVSLKTAISSDFKQVLTTLLARYLVDLPNPDLLSSFTCTLQVPGQMRFQERALQEGVHSMIQALEKNLLASRRPTQRAVQMVEKFLNNCDIKKAMNLISKQKFNWGVKQQLIMANALDNAQEIVQEHKLKRNDVSRAVMHVILELFRKHP